MATFLLVHGSWHGAWCWEKIVPRLTAMGHKAITIDLPGNGNDKTPWWRVTMSAYARAVREAARPHGRVVLVGHSMGGVVITQAANQEPELFQGLIYVCAFVPKRGETLLGLARRDSVWRGFRVPRYRFGTITVNPARAAETFYNNCSKADADAAIARLCPQPMPASVEFVAKPREPAPPKAYIECTQDRTISIGLQRWMHRRFKMKGVATLEADHSPFYSAPDELSAKLVELAALFQA
jgi:pimeloyl-ACP methyl ester carboxylesterase